MSFPEPFDDGKDFPKFKGYDTDPARIRSLCRVLEAYWERHSELQLMQLLEKLMATWGMPDSKLSDALTRRLNAELADELKIK
jgi:uncharacterized protein YihD (DUF1040 family)